MRSLVRRLFRVATSVPPAACSSGSILLAFVDVTSLLPPERLLSLGTAYGRWTIPVDSGLNGRSVCYCAGAGEDISFDCALAQRFHCTVRIIDPTPRAIRHFEALKEAMRAGGRFPINNSENDYYAITIEEFQRLSFHPVGLSDGDRELKFYLPKNPAHVSCSTVNLQKTDKYFLAPCFRLGSIMRQEGDASLDLLKMDIEGGEYTVIRDLVATRLLPRILLIEFDEVHTPLDSNANDRIREHIDLLRQAGMTCVAVERSGATFVRTQ
jgi:FkbM family methyltransferase